MISTTGNGNNMQNGNSLVTTIRFIALSLSVAMLGTSCLSNAAYLKGRTERDIATTQIEEAVGQLFMLSLRLDAEGVQRKAARSEERRVGKECIYRW